MLGIYSDINFIPSIGLGSGERRPPDVGLLADLLGQDEVSLPDSDDRSDFSTIVGRYVEDYLLPLIKETILHRKTKKSE